MRFYTEEDLKPMYHDSLEIIVLDLQEKYAKLLQESGTKKGFVGRVAYNSDGPAFYITKVIAMDDPGHNDAYVEGYLLIAEGGKIRATVHLFEDSDYMMLVDCHGKDGTLGREPWQMWRHGGEGRYLNNPEGKS
jgi:hypothetical protein